MGERPIVSPEVKSHPDYSDGYFDGLNARESADKSDQYRAGYCNGEWARGLFESHGFTQSDDSEFSVSMTLRARSGEHQLPRDSDR